MATSAPDGNEDVPSTINPGEAQRQSDQAAMSGTHMESVGGNLEYNDEEQEEAKGD